MSEHRCTATDPEPYMLGAQCTKYKGHVEDGDRFHTSFEDHGGNGDVGGRWED